MKNSWRNNLRPASWRGVVFEVGGDESDFGRNVAVHEFVQRDKPYVEDLGRKTRKLRLDAWICASIENGFNPWPQRDALIDAVEEGGIGTLVHPFYGSLRGHIVSMGVRQNSTQSGGMIGITLEFVEAGEKDFKASTIEDTRGAVGESAEATYAAAEEEFGGAFSIDGVREFVLTDAVGMLKQLKSVLVNVQRVQGIVAQVAQGNLGAIGILAEPLSLARQITSIIRSMTQPSALQAFNRPPVPAVNTVGRNQQRANQAAFVHLVQVSSLARSAELAADLGANSARFSAASTFVRDTPALITRQEMVAARQEVTASITDELLVLSGLQMYPQTQAALLQLRTDTVLHMTAEGEHLARTFTTNACDGTSWGGFMQPLVLAYRHYGVLNDDVINDRNQIPNPLFVQPGAAVELLAEVTA
ncbi:MAG TPA: DNA circularization N-terminal domain-containing protein [Polaromonas sp.]|uniref:DNA circularization protein n=1 Tax=Polaromonas sp. TaxID=1869339 RepID=UPI002D50C152|nr:DNA circularization N-terminal domain-containing protein [Polaromonas sp.]HYW57673.1 DNA circularization N-terminal domain-containing protein [Polaromonas sp.]